MLRLPQSLPLLSVSVMVVTAVVGIGACGHSDKEENVTTQGTQLLVVTTISPLRNIIENIGGDRVEVVGLIPEGVSSHTFEPPPSAVRLLANAALVIANGLNLNSAVLEIARSSSDAEIVLLGDTVIAPDDYMFSSHFPEGDGVPNPHAWVDPIIAIQYAKVVSESISKIDPNGEDYYASNFSAFREKGNDLNLRFAEAISTIPSSNRRLLTYHDSFPYFGLRYGLEIIAAIQPSDFSDPSPRDVADLIDQIQETDLPAIFGSEVFPSEVLDQIAGESGAIQVATVRDDDLPGSPGDAINTYFSMMIENVRTIVISLGGDATILDGVDVSDTWIQFEDFKVGV